MEFSVYPLITAALFNSALVIMAIATIHTKPLVKP